MTYDNGIVISIHLPSKTSSGHIIAASVGDIIPPQSEEELTFRDPRTILEIEHLDRPKEHFDNFI